MTDPVFDKDAEKPLDPAVDKVRRKMIRFMGVNLGLLFVALMAVVGAIVYKSRSVPPAPQVTGLTVPAGGMVEGRIPLPAGARIVSQSLSGERISLLVEGAGGAQTLYVFDLPARRIVGRFDVGQE